MTNSAFSLVHASLLLNCFQDFSRSNAENLIFSQILMAEGCFEQLNKFFGVRFVFFRHYLGF